MAMISVVNDTQLCWCFPLWVDQNCVSDIANHLLYFRLYITCRTYTQNQLSMLVFRLEKGLSLLYTTYE